MRSYAKAARSLGTQVTARWMARRASITLSKSFGSITGAQRPRFGQRRRNREGANGTMRALSETVGRRDAELITKEQERPVHLRSAQSISDLSCP
jgi:hypothetical protein